MKWIILFSFAVLSGVDRVQAQVPGGLRPHGWLELQGHATRIVDGNNFRLVDAKGVEHQVRLLDAETPELSQPYGVHAKKVLVKALENKTIRVVHRFFDGHGRILGRVYVGKVWVNRELVEQGLAWARPDADPVLRKAMAQARAAKKGLWASEHPIPPWFWRRGARVYRAGMENAPLPPELPYSPSTNDRPLIGVGF